MLRNCIDDALHALVAIPQLPLTSPLFFATQQQLLRALHRPVDWSATSLSLCCAFLQVSGFFVVGEDHLPTVNRHVASFDPKAWKPIDRYRASHGAVLWEFPAHGLHQLPKSIAAALAVAVDARSQEGEFFVTLGHVPTMYSKVQQVVPSETDRLLASALAANRVATWAEAAQVARGLRNAQISPLLGSTLSSQLTLLPSTRTCPAGPALQLLVNWRALTPAALTTANGSDRMFSLLPELLNTSSRTMVGSAATLSDGANSNPCCDPTLIHGRVCDAFSQHTQKYKLKNLIQATEALCHDSAPLHSHSIEASKRLIETMVVQVRQEESVPLRLLSLCGSIQLAQKFDLAPVLELEELAHLFQVVVRRKEDKAVTKEFLKQAGLRRLCRQLAEVARSRGYLHAVDVFRI